MAESSGSERLDQRLVELFKEASRLSEEAREELVRRVREEDSALAASLDELLSSLPDASLAWSSNRDGAMGTGSRVVYNDLSVGSHTVTLTATDSDGLKGSATVAVTVNEVPVLPPIPPGAVLLADDMDDENNGVAKTNYTGFENWNVTRECVDLHGPGSIDQAHVFRGNSQVVSVVEIFWIARYGFIEVFQHGMRESALDIGFPKIRFELN